MPLDPKKVQFIADGYEPDNSRLRSVAADAESLTPEAAAKASQLAKRGGWRPQVVASDIPGFEVEDLNRRLDTLRATDPTTADFLTDPHRMALVKDDIEGTSTLGQAVRNLLPGANLALAPFKGLARSQAGASAQYGTLTALAATVQTGLDLLDQTNPLKPLFGGLADLSKDPAEKAVLREMSDPVGYQAGAEEAARVASFGRAGSGAIQKEVGSLPTGKDWLANPAGAMEQATATLASGASASAPLMLPALVTRNPALGAMAMGVPTGAMTTSELLADGVDRPTAYAAGLATGAAEFAGESVGLSALLKKPWREALWAGPATEYGQEFVTQLMQDAVEGTAKGEDLDASQMLWAAHEAGLTGAFTGGAVTGVRGAFNASLEAASARSQRGQNAVTERLGTVERSANAAIGLSDLVAKAGAAKLTERDPDEAEAFVAHQIGETDANVYVPAAEFRTLFQEGEAAKMAEELTGNPEALNEAGENGDIIIPLAKYVARVTRLPNAAEITHVARMEADGLSRKELESLDLDAEAASLTGQQVQEDDAFAAKRDEVQQGILAGLMSTGRYKDTDAELMAMLHARMLGTLAKRTSANPAEKLDTLAQKYNLRINGQATDVGGVTLDQPAYHGTPHTVDKFSLNKIGTGEGAQAYGWGLYFASEKAIAEHYRDTLTPKVALDGKPLDRMQTSMIQSALANMFQNRLAAGLDEQAARDQTLRWAGGNKQIEDEQAARDFVGRLSNGKGNLYRVDVPEDADLLDYDKPMSENPPAVRERAKQVWDAMPEWWQDEVLDRTNAEFDDLTGAEFYQVIGKFADEGGMPGKYGRPDSFTRSVDGKEAASHALYVAGIPGLRYLDAGSRGDWQITPPSQTAAGDWMVKDRSKPDSKGLHFDSEADARAELDRRQQTGHNYVIWDEGAISEPVTLNQSAPQTDTAAFKAWFGGSKVVNEKGEPLVVYHGTNADFIEFASGDGMLGRGIYFTPKAEAAPLYPKMQNMRAVREGRDPGPVSVVPVFVSLKNPLTFTELPVGKVDAAKVAAQGFDGIVLLNPDGSIKELTAFRPEQIKSATANNGNFDPNDPSILNQAAEGVAPQGQIQIAPDRTMSIGLMENADRSTFFHESAHFFLEVMTDLAAEEDAPQQVRDDFAAIQQFVGAERGEAFTTEQHERWARSWELYLRSGKAPTPELVRPFARFARWLTEIYRYATNLMAAGAKEISPDIRAVMDRMVAVDEEIALSSARSAPMDATALGLTEAQWGTYVGMLEAATDDARARVTAQVMEAEAKEHEAAWKEEREAVIKDLMAALEGTPTFKAWRALQGRGENGTLKLDASALKAMYDADQLKALRRLDVYRTEGGVHPDIVASLLGFESGDALVQALLSIRNYKAELETAADNVMRVRHPDPMADLPAKVEKALHGSKQVAALEAELGLLSRVTGQPATPYRVLRAIAERALASRAVRQIRPNDYLVAERKAAREATKAAAKGDYALAMQQKRDQLQQAALYSAAMAAQENAAKQVKALQKAAKPATVERIGKAGKEYVDALESLLDGHELRPVSAKTVARRDSLRAWVAKMQEGGSNTAVSEALLARVEQERVTNVADLTIQELADLHEAVQNLLHLARLKNELLTTRGKMQWEEAKAALIEQLKKDNIRHNKANGGGIELFRSLADGYAAGMNWVLQPETLIEWLDKGSAGPFHDLLWEPSNAAEFKRDELHTRVGDLLKTALDGLPAGDLKALDQRWSFTLADQPVTFTGHQILSALLNMGTASNRNKLVNGGFVLEDGIVGLPETVLAEMFAKLTGKQAEMVQGIWDAVGSLWPDIVAQEEELSGITPERLEPQAFTVQTKDGPVALRGGYFPAVYDPRGGKVGQFSEDEQAKKTLAGQTPIRAATSKGHTETRTDYTAPLLLDWHAVLSRHLDGVMSDIAYRRFLAQAYRVLTDPEIYRLIDNRHGQGAAKGLRRAFEIGAVGQAGLLGPLAQYLGPFTNVANSTMTNISAAALGLRVPLAVANTVTAPMLAAARIKPTHLVKAMLHYYRDMKGSMEMIHRLSPDMVKRAQARSTEFAAILDTLRNKRTYRKRMIELTMSVHQWIVPLMENAIWMAAYMQEQAAGSDIRESVRMADKAIRQTQTKHRARDLSAAEAGWMRPLMMFAGPMVVVNNRLQESGLRGLRGVVDNPIQAAGVWIAMAAGGALVFELMMGRGPDDDDEDGLDAGDWMAWALKKTALQPFAAFPILREIASYADNGFSRPNPLVDAGVRLEKFGERAVEAGASPFNDEEVEWDKFAGSGLDAAGVVTGIPSSQMKKSGAYIGEVLAGERTPRNPAAEAYYLMQGPPKD